MQLIDEVIFDFDHVSRSSATLSAICSTSSARIPHVTFLPISQLCSNRSLESGFAGDLGAD
jgi:hypothetical protein